MDNKYQGQGQFGQNQQMQNPYGQNSYAPNQQMQYQYGQGVNPNIYNGGTPPMQNQYGQAMYGYNNPIPPMDPALHAQKVNKANKSKKIFIGVIIGAVLLSIIGFVAIIAFAISLGFKTYDVSDYNQVAKACEDILDVELKKMPEEYFEYYFGYDDYNVAEFAIGSMSNSSSEGQLIWIEFTNESDADTFYLYVSDEIEEEHEDIKDNYSANKITAGFNSTESSLTRNGMKYISSVLQQDKCVLVIYMEGKKAKTTDLYEDFVDELD